MLNQQEGAEVSLGDYLYIKGRIGWKGLKKSEYLSDSDYRIINGESLTMSGIDWNKAGYISKERYDESPEIMLEVGDILLSKDGTIGKIGYVDELERPTTVASGIFVIRNLRKDVLSTHFVYYLLKSRLFKAFIASRTEGSVIPHLYQKDFVEFLFPLPPVDVMKKLDKLTGPMFQQTIVNAHENKRLAELRDALLPKLMSGEIDVSKIDLTQLNSHLTECVQEIKGGAVEPNLTFYSSKHPAIVKFLIRCGKMVLGIIQSHPVAFFANALDGVFEGPAKLLDAGIHLIKHDLILVHSHQQSLVGVNIIGNRRIRLALKHERCFL